MDFQLSGKLFEIYPTQQKTEKFKAREFVLETTKQVGERDITDYVKFQATGDKCDVLNRYKTGDTVTIHFNIRGNKWEKDGKVSYFTNLDAWRIEGNQATNSPYNNITEEQFNKTNDTAAPYEPANNDAPTGDFNDDLPF